MKHVLFVLALVITVGVAAQKVTLRGVVYDLLANRPLSGVSIINPQSGFSAVTDADGKFDISISKQDVMFLFYPTYHTVKFSLNDSTDRTSYYMTLPMEPLSTGLNQTVIIRAPKTLEDIEADRKKLGITPRELEKPQTNFFTSPISALYEMLSARAQEREKLKKQIVENERRKIFFELLRYYNENELIDLPEDYYDDFERFCSLPVDFIKNNTDYTITKTIVELYNKYGRLNGIIK